jgi:hypothetical protein
MVLARLAAPRGAYKSERDPVGESDPAARDADATGLGRRFAASERGKRRVHLLHKSEGRTSQVQIMIPRRPDVGSYQ